MKKNFTVAVCDTQKNDAGILAELVDTWLARTENVQGHTVVFTDYSELRDSISSGLSVDICVFGIPTHGLSAVDNARKLLRTYPGLPVIFAAAGKNYAFDAYELHVIRYILKPVSPEELFSALDLAGLICVSAPASRLAVRTEEGIKLIPSDDVIYIENNVRSMKYVMADGTTIVGTRRNISFEKYFAELLGSGKFVQPHKSFIINLRYIRSLRLTLAFMANGAHIPISRRHAAEIREAYRKYGA